MGWSTKRCLIFVDRLILKHFFLSLDLQQLFSYIYIYIYIYIYVCVCVCVYVCVCVCVFVC